MTLRRSIFAIVLAAAALLVTAGCADGPPPAPPTADRPDGLLAAAAGIEGWELEDEPQLYVGDALFELINGGAELYHQHGFVRAMAAEYVDADGRTIALEVFEMADRGGAAEIYAEKTGGWGEPVRIGDEAALESYYMNARTGPYLITITGFESDDATTDGIRRLAAAVVAELGGER